MVENLHLYGANAEQDLRVSTKKTEFLVNFDARFELNECSLAKKVKCFEYPGGTIDKNGSG